MAAKLQAGESIYVYGFTFADIAPPSLLGVDDRHLVTAHRYADLNAVISAVDLLDYTGASGESNLQNVAWITPRACRHALVLDKMQAQGAPVYPVSFGTLFSSLAAMERELARCSVDVQRVLQHISGCQEWSIEATLDRNLAIEVLLAEGLASGRFCLPTAAGRRHLEEQKLRRNLSADLDDWLAQCFSAFQEALLPLQRDFRERKLLDNKVLHWAYLLPLENVAGFQEQMAGIVKRYAAYGLNFRITGPWVAYSFCQHTSS